MSRNIIVLCRCIKLLVKLFICSRLCTTQLKRNRKDISITTQLADIASQEVGKGASLVGIHDADALFAATTVEGALKESITQANAAFTSASNGKQVVGDAITGVDPNVQIPTNPSFNDLANAIERIEVGYVAEVGNVVVYQNMPESPETFGTDWPPTRSDKYTFVGIKGTYRVSYEVQGIGMYYASRIRVNGEPVGIKRSLASNYVKYTEDITVSAGDEIGIYWEKNSDISAGGTVKVRFFELKCLNPIFSK